MTVCTGIISCFNPMLDMLFFGAISMTLTWLVFTFGVLEPTRTQYANAAVLNMLLSVPGLLLVIIAWPLLYLAAATLVGFIGFRGVSWIPDSVAPYVVAVLVSTLPVATVIALANPLAFFW